MVENKNMYLEYRKIRFLSKNVVFCKIRFFVIIFQQKPQIKFLCKKMRSERRKLLIFRIIFATIYSCIL